MAEPRRRDFEEVLSDLDDGRVVQQLTTLWPKIVQAVTENNKSGSLTLTLTAKSESHGMVSVAAKVTTKTPAPTTGPTLFYTDENHNVMRNDPKQLPLKVVPPTPINKPGA